MCSQWQVLLFIVTLFGVAKCEFYGVSLGDFSQLAHGLKGKVYVVDEKTILVEHFFYDGEGPDAFFWIGKGPEPHKDGKIVPFPVHFTGSEPPILQEARDENLLLRLPDNMTIKDIDWIAVWCRQYAHNFGFVRVPKDFKAPAPVELSSLTSSGRGARSGRIVIVDEMTLHIPNFNYVAETPDAYFIVGNGNLPTTERPDYIRLSDEQRRPLILARSYSDEGINVKIPPGHSIHDFEWLAVFCRTCNHDMGYVMIPTNLLVPPAIEQLPLPTTNRQAGPSALGFQNCIEPFPGMMQIFWVTENNSLIIQMAGKINERQYMAFGVSASRGRSQMIGSDVVVGYYDSGTASFKAQDYFMTDKAQCDGSRGVCPDTKLSGSNDVVLVNGQRVNGLTILTYTKPLTTGDIRNDIPINLREPINVIAAIGPLNERNEPNIHTTRTGPESNIQVTFGATGTNTCKGSLIAPAPIPGGPSTDRSPGNQTPQMSTPWKKNVLMGVSNFTAQIGPTGGDRGYKGWTGLPSWGYSWWINGLLIPEIYVERGKTYTFTIEGGDVRDNPGKYHPFYITTSPTGGYIQKSSQEKQKEMIFAGAEKDPSGNYQPTAIGRVCEWIHESTRKPEDYQTFDDYKSDMKLECGQGSSAHFTWTVPQNAPDELYYQCFTHSNLGWKILVTGPKTNAVTNDGSSITHTGILSIVAMLFVKLMNL